MSVKRTKNKLINFRVTEQKKAEWEAYLALNDLKSQEVLEAYVDKLLYKGED